MANKINEIVDVLISRETTVIDQASFNTALFFSPTVPFAEQSRDYTSPSALIEDGFVSSDPAYKAASAYFSQSPRPAKLTVGSAGRPNLVKSTKVPLPKSETKGILHLWANSLSSDSGTAWVNPLIS